MKFLLFFNLFILPNLAYAYIGPGMGAGLSAVILGLFLAIIIFIFSIVLYPLKRFFKKKKTMVKKSKNLKK